MRNLHIAALTLVLACSASGCKGDIELVGYGSRPGIQHNLKVELISNGSSGALIRVQNLSNNIMSINQSPLAMMISVRMRTAEGLTAVEPEECIKVHMNASPRPDDFVIIAPRQTRTVSVPVSYRQDRYRTLDQIFHIEKGNMYEVEVRLDPYFGTFTRETASKTLADFMIPNYLSEPLMMNTMTIRAR